MPAFDSFSTHAARLVKAALAAADPLPAVAARLRWQGEALHVGERAYQPRRIFLIGVGKAVERMAAAALPILSDRLHRGILIYKRGHTLPPLPPTVTTFPADHPVPTQANLAATQAVLDLLATTQPDDLVLCLISGGTSALLTQPTLPLPDWQNLSRALLASGCSIQAFNRVRQWFDPIKGGGLVAAAAPAPCASLILSDVVGNPLDLIGSGPTVPVSRDAAAVQGILDQYVPGFQHFSRSAFQHFSQSATQHSALSTQSSPLSPHPSVLSPNSVLKSSASLYNSIVADGRRMAEAVAAEAAALGFTPQLLTTHLQGEAREVGKVAAALALDAPPDTCLILAGETTVTLEPDGTGQGGRNQELVLAAALALSDVPGVVVASFASDGEDGPTDAAGALITGQTVAQGREKGLAAADYLTRHDSHTFFTTLGDTHLICPGPTGTNVNDCLIILRYKV